MRTIHGIEYYVGTRAERLGEIPQVQPGHEFFETDTSKTYLYTGVGWIEKEPIIAMEGRGLAANRPALEDRPIGFIYWSVDTGLVEVHCGDAWKEVGEV